HAAHRLRPTGVVAGTRCPGGICDRAMVDLLRRRTTFTRTVAEAPARDRPVERSLPLYGSRRNALAGCARAAVPSLLFGRTRLRDQRPGVTRRQTRARTLRSWKGLRCHPLRHRGARGNA